MPAPLLRQHAAALFALACSFPMGSHAAGHGTVGDTILLGQSAPFSGPSSQMATEFNLGARTYLQAVDETAA